MLNIFIYSICEYWGSILLLNSWMCSHCSEFLYVLHHCQTSYSGEGIEKVQINCICLNRKKCERGSKDNIQKWPLCFMCVLVCNRLNLHTNLKNSMQRLIVSSYYCNTKRFCSKLADISVCLSGNLWTKVHVYMLKMQHQTRLWLSK